MLRSKHRALAMGFTHPCRQGQDRGTDMRGGRRACRGAGWQILPTPARLPTQEPKTHTAAQVASHGWLLAQLHLSSALCQIMQLEITFQPLISSTDR